MSPREGGVKSEIKTIYALKLWACCASAYPPDIISNLGDTVTNKFKIEYE